MLTFRDVLFWQLTNPDKPETNPDKPETNPDKPETNQRFDAEQRVCFRFVRVCFRFVRVCFRFVSKGVYQGSNIKLKIIIILSNTFVLLNFRQLGTKNI